MPDNIEFGNDAAMVSVPQSEQKLENDFKEGKIDFSEFKRQMLKDVITNSQIIETHCIGHIRLEDVEKALEHPSAMWRVLVQASNILMHISPHYNRLNTLYANMALFNWGISISTNPFAKPNVNKIAERYGKVAMKLDAMNIKHEFSKIMRTLPYQDVYCGLVVENDLGDFFFQKIDYNICKLYQIQDGLYNFRIDLGRIKATEIKAYPSYIQDAYVDYIEGKSQTNWYLPPADKQICIKMNSQWTYPFPILISLVRDILDLDVYKKLKLQSARTDNYKAILVEVPIDESKVDTPLLSPNVLSVFANLNRESMSKDIGMIHTLGSKGEAISFKDSANTRNNVGDAVDEIYNASGTSKELFNSGGTATSMTLSVENDAGIVYGVYRQFERWVNRFIKLRKLNMPKATFKFYINDMTVFNKTAVMKELKENAALGLAKDKWIAASGVTPAEMFGYSILSENVFDYVNTLVPLTSAYNASAAVQESEGGRPTAEDKGESLSDEGEETKDLGKNDM